MELPTKDDVQLYTLEEARALLPEAGERIQAIREAVDELQFAEGQVQDLEQRWPEATASEGTEPHEALTRFRQQAATARTTVDEHLLWFEEHGIEVKDPILGLVDFFAEHPETGELVYLCWRDGEETIEAWHSLTGGFAGREPVDGF